MAPRSLLTITKSYYTLTMQVIISTMEYPANLAYYICIVLHKLVRIPTESLLLPNSKQVLRNFTSPIPSCCKFKIGDASFKTRSSFVTTFVTTSDLLTGISTVIGSNKFLSVVDTSLKLRHVSHVHQLANV